jgi:DUF1365 family protein
MILIQLVLAESQQAAFAMQQARLFSQQFDPLAVIFWQHPEPVMLFSFVAQHADFSAQHFMLFPQQPGLESSVQQALLG